MNYKRKSTTGYSIKGVISDLIGGLFSMMQMLIDGYNYGKSITPPFSLTRKFINHYYIYFPDDFASIFGDPTKFGLGLFSALFDILFLIQHFVLYPHKYAVAAKTEPTNDTKVNDQKINMLN